MAHSSRPTAPGVYLGVSRAGKKVMCGNQFLQRLRALAVPLPTKLRTDEPSERAILVLGRGETHSEMRRRDAPPRCADELRAPMPQAWRRGSPAFSSRASRPSGRSNSRRVWGWSSRRRLACSCSYERSSCRGSSRVASSRRSIHRCGASASQARPPANASRRCSIWRAVALVAFPAVTLARGAQLRGRPRRARLDRAAARARAAAARELRGIDSCSSRGTGRRACPSGIYLPQRGRRCRTSTLALTAAL